MSALDNEGEVVVESASQAALRSAGTWEELNLKPELLKGIYEKRFIKPSRIQEKALPIVLESKSNLIAQAHNGSGKTATFALCMLATVNTSLNVTQSLCVCHTRELAKQNMDVIRELGQYITGLTCWLAVPSNNESGADSSHIVVGTPGKLKDCIKKRQLKTKDLQLFILDEADVMMAMDSSMAAQVADIRRSIPKNIQTLLFSATYPDRVRSFCQTHIPNAVTLSIKKEELALSAVSQYYIKVQDEAEKLKMLTELYVYLQLGQSVIFVNTRKTAFHVATKMREEGHAISLICGGSTGPDTMDYAAREKVMSEFRSGITKVLIATDLIARGIDVPQVTMVVNYDLPIKQNAAIDQETYLHRIGRTGRFGANGIAINLCTVSELKNLDEIQKFYACTISELPTDGEVIEKMVKGLRE